MPELEFDGMIENEEDNEELFYGCYTRDDRKGHEIPFSKVKKALTLACMSKLAYRNYYIAKILVNKCPNVPAGQSTISRIHNRRTDTQGFIVEYQSYVSVTFRGSSSLNDWINNFKIRPITDNGVNFHKGFYESLNSVYGSIKQRLRSPMSRGKTIYITGHSLGGALATILTYRLAVDNPQYRTQLKLYSFGAPPAGTIGLTGRFKKYGIESFSVTVIGDYFSYERCFAYKVLHSSPLKYVKPNTVYLPHKGPISTLLAHLISVYISQLKSIQTLNNYNKEYQQNLLLEY